MSRNVIACAFAFREDYGASTQLTTRSDAQRLRIYLCNAVVALVSAKRQNPEDEVLLVTTAALPAEYQTQLEENGVEIRIVEFSSYQMPKRFPWALAFYKLCALEALAAAGYERILLMDLDTVSMRPYTELWQEADHGLLLYPIGHSYLHPERAIIREDYARLYPGKTGNVVHYGGELVCGCRSALRLFLEECRAVYTRMAELDFPVAERTGDESILAYAAMRYKAQGQPLYEAGAYIYRYWTEKGFYLVSTNTIHNPVCIWHVPGEKDKGMVLLYRYFRKKGKLPEPAQAARLLGIAPAKRPYPLTTLYAQYVRRRGRV